MGDIEFSENDARKKLFGDILGLLRQNVYGWYKFVRRMRIVCKEPFQARCGCHRYGRHIVFWKRGPKEFIWGYVGSVAPKCLWLILIFQTYANSMHIVHIQYSIICKYGNSCYRNCLSLETSSLKLSVCATCITRGGSDVSSNSTLCFAAQTIVLHVCMMGFIDAAYHKRDLVL